MKKLRNMNNANEKLVVNVSARKAVLKDEHGSTNYTAFIEFDKNNDYEKILGIRLVNCF